MTDYEKLLEAADTVGDSLEAMQLSRRLATALREVMAERDEAQAKVRWFVEHAADEKLDGYRELGARAAKAENERDTAHAEVEAMRAVVRDAKADAERANDSAWGTAEELRGVRAECEAMRVVCDAARAAYEAYVHQRPSLVRSKRWGDLHAALRALDARGKGQPR